MPGWTVCGVPGCPELTRGNFCDRHADMTLDEQVEVEREIRRRRARFDELRCEDPEGYEVEHALDDLVDLFGDDDLEDDE